MRRRWGTERARLLSQRLQQLYAMTSLDDLGFMPFDSHERADGVVEIAIDDDTSLFVEGVDRRQEDGRVHPIVIITAVAARSAALR